MRIFYNRTKYKEIQHFFYRVDYWNAGFNKALTTQQTFWRELYISPIDGIRKIAYIVPVYSQGKLIGLMGFSIRLQLLIDDLKGINDQFGHAMGDELLCQTVQFIKSIYTHSPIFRVGGDEFLVLIQGEDYSNRFTLLEKIKPCNKKRNDQQERLWEQIAFAAGMSDYQPETRRIKTSFFALIAPCIKTKNQQKDPV